MNPAIRQLEIFEALARELHFGRTADVLGLSQPIVSQEIGRLERYYGGRLFTRSTRMVELTDLGRGLLPGVREVLAGLDELRLMAAQHQRRQVVVTVACTPSVIDRLFPLLLQEAERSAPDVVINEVAVDTGGVERAMRTADIGLGRFIEQRPGFQVERMGCEPVYALLASSHPSAQEPTIDLGALEDLPLLIWPRAQAPAYYDEIIRICHERQLDPQLVTAPPRIVGVRSYLISEGRTFSLVPESTTNQLPPGIRARQLSRAAVLPLDATWRRVAADRSEVARVLAILRRLTTTQP